MRQCPRAMRRSPWAMCFSPWAMRHRPRAMRHLPRAMCFSPRAMRHLPRAMRFSPRAMRHRPRAMRFSPWAMRHLPWALRRRPRGERDRGGLQENMFRLAHTVVYERAGVPAECSSVPAVLTILLLRVPFRAGRAEGYGRPQGHVELSPNDRVYLGYFQGRHAGMQAGYFPESCS